MGTKTRNSNYDILDKILADAGLSGRTSGNGVWVVDEDHPEGYLVTNQETLDQLRKSTDAIEKHLRS